MSEDESPDIPPLSGPSPSDRSGRRTAYSGLTDSEPAQASNGRADGPAQTVRGRLTRRRRAHDAKAAAARTVLHDLTTAPPDGGNGVPDSLIESHEPIDALEHPDVDAAVGSSGAPPVPPDTLEPDGPLPARTRPRLKKLRFALILFAVLLLGLVSFVFGMFMAVASDLPSLDNRAEFNNARNSVLLDDQGKPIGVLADHHRILVTEQDLNKNPIVKQAVVAVEDKRFYTNSGIDFRGIARALEQDVLHNKGVQGASTIPQQFVKNVLQAQNHRTLFEKMREAALAYHLTRKWSKDKILTQYLNTIYFGNGAYGIESAARTYFGEDPNHQGCGATPGNLCVTQLKPYEAALLAGMIASPSGYDPARRETEAKARRDLVLKDMLQQGYIDRTEYDTGITAALPAAQDILPPHQTQVGQVQSGYFADWVRQQVIDVYGPQLAFNGGLKIKTSLDLGMQQAAENAIKNYLGYSGGPTASLVAIDNATGEVKAMVGGTDYYQRPFNLATEGERQPGSAFKAFDLAQALSEGVSPDSVWTSAPKVLYARTPIGIQRFVVHNDNNAYSGTISLSDATAYSDNSVFAELGIKAGLKKIADRAHAMGIRTPIFINPAMTIGGLKIGVTPLDMAHAYETLAHGGQRVDSSLLHRDRPADVGPSGIDQVEAPGGQTLPDGHHVDHNQPLLIRVLSPDVASTETSLLQGVIQYGTATHAQIGQFAAGKTGTTSNFGDAWFVGWNNKYTVAVWVGYPDKLVSMNSDYNGQPVMGGTFPADIWHDFMLQAIALDQQRAANQAANSSGSTSNTTSTGTGTTTTPSPSGPASAPGSSSSASGGSSGRSGSSSGGTTPQRAPTGGSGTAAPPAQPAPAPSNTPAPTASPAPSGGGGQGSGSPGSGNAGGAAAPTGGVSPGG